VKLMKGALLACVVVLVAAACSSSGRTASDAAPAAPLGTTSDGAAGPATGSWMQIPLVDARTGATFTLADFKGKPLYVENFATWCSNCRHQLGNVQDAAAAKGDGATFVSLSVETDLSAKDVASYADKEGFDNIRFAVMTPQMLAAMNSAFGTTALNPPSTPHFYVTSDGQIGQLATGYEDASEIQSNLATAASN
jgi:cytochrome oxidase Cu insertion factor (SCO1/SenC/PrrC family)